MDAVDIKNRLSREAFVCLHVMETCFQISTHDVENPVICYHCFETLPKHRSYGVVRKFSSLEEASNHYESLLKDNPDPVYVLQPNGPLYRKSVESDVYLTRYPGVFEVFEHWMTNFQSKNRSDEDIYRISSKVGPALASRYERTDSVGYIFNDTVITDDEQVLFWNWAPRITDYETEIRQLRYYARQMKNRATNPDRFNKFEDFLDTHVLKHPAPRKELRLWLFHHPVFMTEEGGVRFLEALNKITSDTRTGILQTTQFKYALRGFNNQWKSIVTASSDGALKAVLNSNKAKKYEEGGHDLPRFAHNCVKHYLQNAIKENAKNKRMQTLLSLPPSPRYVLQFVNLFIFALMNSDISLYFDMSANPFLFH